MREDSIVAELGRRHGAHDSADNSLQITINSNMHDEEQYCVIVKKDPGAEHFQPKMLFRGDLFLTKVRSDFMCLERYTIICVTKNGFVHKTSELINDCNYAFAFT